MTVTFDEDVRFTAPLVQHVCAVALDAGGMAGDDDS